MEEIQKLMRMYRDPEKLGQNKLIPYNFYRTVMIYFDDRGCRTYAPVILTVSHNKINFFNKGFFYIAEIPGGGTSAKISRGGNNGFTKPGYQFITEFIMTYSYCY